MAKEASLDDCLKLLKGDSDEQRLVGLLLATKFVKGDDIGAVRKLFDAIGFNFINRLIKTGVGEIGRHSNAQRSYLHLALSILAAFCRVPELASSDETITKVPVLLTTVASKEDEAAAEDCYECLLSIAASSEKGLQALVEYRTLSVVAHQLHGSAPDAPWLPVALKLLHSLLVKVAADNRIADYVHDLTIMIPPVAKQFSVRQDLVKFEALSILYSLLVPDIMIPVKAALGDSASTSEWPAHARTGVGQILQSRVAVEQKYLVLELAVSVVEVFGITWLAGFTEVSGQHGGASSDRFFLLMVETLRVETAVLLNEVARIAFDSEQDAEASKAAQETIQKQRRLMKFFCLLESVISVASAQEGKSSSAEAGKEMDELTLQKTIIALDEVVGNILELLEDAQAHGQTQGDILLASVSIISRYLAEAPSAHLKRCLNLLQFLLSISAESDSRPFLAVQFLLPFLTQITLDVDGCKALLDCRGHIQIINLLSWAVHRTNEITCSLVDLFDILLNLLTKKYKLKNVANVWDFLPVLPALVTLVGQGITKMESAMAASICTSVLALTDEDFLTNKSKLGPDGLHRVFEIVILNLEQCFQGGGDDVEDLLEIVLSESMESLGRYPSFKQELKAWLQRSVGNRKSSIQDIVPNPSLQQLVAVVLND